MAHRVVGKMDEIIGENQIDIKSLILTVRGTQVLLDSDVAMLYGYETKYVNRAASRNKARFPECFRFQLTGEEFESIQSIMSQNVTLYTSEHLSLKNTNSLTNDAMRRQNGTASKRNIRYRPYVFTEQGIAMLSGLLKSDVAVQVSVGIMQAFVEMRRFISVYGKAFERISTVEYRLIEHDKKFDELFDLIQAPSEFSQGIFYKGQIYDAFKLIMDIVHSAEKSIVIIDNYVDDSVLDMLAKKKTDVAVTIITDKPSRISGLAVNKYIAQYSDLQIIKSEDFHDRFIIIDSSKLFHVGASLKDAGKKCFAVSVLDNESCLQSIMAATAKK